MAKLLVTDDLWALIEPLLPKHVPSPKGGKRRVPDRVCLTGILFVLKTRGCKHHVVADALNERKKPLNGAKVLVLGLAYKRDVDDMRQAPSIQLIGLLRERGAKVDYNDPHIPRIFPQREHSLRMRSVPLTTRNLSRYDCVLIATDHSAYDYAKIVRNSRLVVDTRNATAGVKGPKKNVVKA